jgi:hypothetical protein
LYFCFTAAQATLWATSSCDSFPAPLGSFFVFLESVVERLAIDVLRVGRQIVLHAGGQLAVGSVGHGSLLQN